MLSGEPLVNPGMPGITDPGDAAGARWSGASSPVASQAARRTGRAMA